MATNWVDQKLNKNRTKKGTPSPMPHPGDPSNSLDEIRARQALGYKSPTPANSGSGIDASDRMKIAGGTHNIISSPVADPSGSLPVIDPLGDLNEIYKQLLNSLSQSPTVLNDKQIRKLAEDQIKMQFDPQIKALKQDMAERKQRYRSNKAEVQDLYADLKAQYDSERGNSNNAYSDAQSQNNMQRQNFDQAAQNNFENSTNYMTDEFNKLGIQDVAKTVYPELQQDTQYQQTLNNADADAFGRYLSSQQASNADYYSKMAANAGYHGAETIEDLLAELNSNLDNTSSQITSLRSNKATSLSDLILQLQQQQQQRLAEAQQQQFQNLLNAGKFGMDISQQRWAMDPNNPSNMKASQQANLPNSGLLGANQMLANSSDPMKLSGIFQQLLQQQPFRENRYQAADGTYVNLSAPQAAQYAQQLGQQMGLNQQDITALVNATYAYFGRLGR